jgi:hypothetical protein
MTPPEGPWRRAVEGLSKPPAPRRPKIPAELTRYPPGCPDPDWCTGNGVCHWRCNEVEDDYAG